MYQVIARKYRPQSFSELIGQEHIQKTLVNAIASNRIAHGYIFSGQRGTGKTTVARILARCLNCVQGPTATPCGVCSSCVEISASNSVDVIEIDAASNRGINEMREIRENVRYRPARDRYKVFIVDEAHQITKEAFNALLKTLEEPPEWVIFILCTTEAYEIPNTIASRCQHFNFRSVDFTEIVNRMKFIAAQEDIDADENVLSVVAQAGEGSVRDSLSALDQAIACCGKTLRVEDVRALLGVFDVDSLRAVADAINAQSPSKMLEIVQELETNGKSLQHFSRELSRYWRNLLVVKIAGKPTRLIAASDAEQQSLLEVAASFTEEDLTRYLNLTLELYKALQTSLQPRLHLELGLIKLVHAGKLQSIEEVLAGLKTPAATRSVPSAEPNALLSASTRSTPPRPSGFQVPAKAPAPSSKRPEEVSANQLVDTNPDNLAQLLFNALSKAKLDFTADAIQHSAVTLQGSELLIRVPKAMLLSLKDPAFQRIASEILGKSVRVRIESGENVIANSLEAPASESRQEAEIRERALSHPGVKRFQELFPDAHVRTVRNLNE
ncbi:MAG: DNA polymerase III subunit gamma/tau [Acidobacteriaceae bacterium]|nr:DNA polymerase III subunit gamma/tau [Acidobacteriaceae bacterium]